MAYGEYGGGANAFSNGLMSGFSFVEGIANQRNRLRLQEEALAQQKLESVRADKYLQLNVDREQRTVAEANEKGKFERRIRLFDAVAAPLVAKVKLSGIGSLTPPEKRKWDLIGDQDEGIAAYNQSEYAQQNVIKTQANQLKSNIALQASAIRLAEEAALRGDRQVVDANIGLFGPQGGAAPAAAPGALPGPAENAPRRPATRDAAGNYYTPGAGSTPITPGLSAAVTRRDVLAPPAPFPGPLTNQPAPTQGPGAFTVPAGLDGFTVPTPAEYFTEKGAKANAEKFWTTFNSAGDDGTAFRAEATQDPRSLVTRYYRERNTLSESDRFLADKNMVAPAEKVASDASAILREMPADVSPRNPQYARWKGERDRALAIIDSTSNAKSVVGAMAIRRESVPVGNPTVIANVQDALDTVPVSPVSPDGASVRSASAVIGRLPAGGVGKLNRRQLESAVLLERVGGLPKNSVTSLVTYGTLPGEKPTISGGDGGSPVYATSFKPDGTVVRQMIAPGTNKWAAEQQSVGDWSPQNDAILTAYMKETRPNDPEAAKASFINTLNINEGALAIAGVTARSVGTMSPSDLYPTLKFIDMYLKTENQNDQSWWVKYGPGDTLAEKTGGDLNKAAPIIADELGVAQSDVPAFQQRTISAENVKNFKLDARATGDQEMLDIANQGDEYILQVLQEQLANRQAR